MVELFKPAEGELVYSRLYNKDLNLGLSVRKSILRGKQLVWRSDEIEVGLVVHRDRSELKVIYYITANQPIKTLSVHFDDVPQLSMSAIPNTLH